MKILHVNTSDILGGAARAVYRLHRSLLNEGINSQVLVQNKSSDDSTVLGPVTKVQKGLAKIRPILDTLPVNRYKHRNMTPFFPAWVPSRTVDTINNLKPDIVHLHWISAGMIRIEDIERIQAPIVWSLHDNWPLTGGCHIMWDCSRYQEACGCCPRLGSSKENDLSHKVFNRKKKTLSHIKNITVVALSHWMYESAKKSNLFSGRETVCLPNPIDTKVFSPVEKNISRELLNLPQNKKLILFGAVAATSDVNKGYTELTMALEQLNIENVELVVFGSSQPQDDVKFRHRVHYLGILHDDVALKLAYSSADVMVVPSLQEAFGQTASESMACGTPVVAFGATGLLDIVDHQQNGYLAKPFDITDLAEGIEWVLSNEEPEALSVNARSKVRNSFDYKEVAPQYIELYHSVLKKETS